MNSNYEALLALTRLGINHPTYLSNQKIDWQSIKDLAEKQGLSAVVLDGIEKLPEGQRPPKVFLLEWIGETLQGYEYRYELYQRAIAELACFYNSHGYKMMVIKGLACGVHWPKPEHRPYGDIDIWQFGQQKMADALLADEKGIDIDQSHHYHTVFFWRDFMVENHYDFINIHHHKSNVDLEKEFKHLAADDSYHLDVLGEKVYLPSPNLHALFLIKHLISHFASANISLRQVLDWAFFVEEHTKEIDWGWLNGLIVKYNMTDFVSCINAICVEELGFDAGIFKGVLFNTSLKERILKDIYEPAFEMEEPKHLTPRLIYKIKRWKGNAWKRRICYRESDWSMFWNGVWSHLLKPASI